MALQIQVFSILAIFLVRSRSRLVSIPYYDTHTACYRSGGLQHNVRPGRKRAHAVLYYDEVPDAYRWQYFLYIFAPMDSSQRSVPYWWYFP